MSFRPKLLNSSREDSMTSCRSKTRIPDRQFPRPTSTVMLIAGGMSSSAARRSGDVYKEAAEALRNKRDLSLFLQEAGFLLEVYYSLLENPEGC
jgi:hypothetical protein